MTAICHAVVVELAGRPSLGSNLKMIAICNEFRASEESQYHYSFVPIEASVGRLSTSPRPGRFADSDCRMRLDSLFRRHSAASNSVNPRSFSKWRAAKDVKYGRRTRIQILASEAFANSRNIDFCGNFVMLFRDTFSWHTSVTFMNCPLVNGNLQPVTQYARSRTHRRVYYGGEPARLPAQPGLRPV